MGNEGGISGNGPVPFIRPESVPAAWALFSGAETSNAVRVTPWEPFGDLSAGDCHSLEGPIGAEIVSAPLGITVYDVTISKCRWGGLE
jgi:hypothetical protein